MSRKAKNLKIVKLFHVGGHSEGQKYAEAPTQNQTANENKTSISNGSALLQGQRIFLILVLIIVYCLHEAKRVLSVASWQAADIE